jgi:hypothetical protein
MHFTSTVGDRGGKSGHFLPLMQYYTVSAIKSNLLKNQFMLCISVCLMPGLVSKFVLVISHLADYANWLS